MVVEAGLSCAAPRRKGVRLGVVPARSRVARASTSTALPVGASWQALETTAGSRTAGLAKYRRPLAGRAAGAQGRRAHHRLGPGGLDGAVSGLLRHGGGGARHGRRRVRAVRGAAQLGGEPRARGAGPGEAAAGAAQWSARARDAGVRGGRAAAGGARPAAHAREATDALRWREALVQGRRPADIDRLLHGRLVRRFGRCGTEEKAVAYYDLVYDALVGEAEPNGERNAKVAELKRTSVLQQCSCSCMTPWCA
jgi:hypothetical protein